jgi:hypothetical protein
MRDAAVGHAIYAEVTFPVAENNQMLVPAGTYVQGEIASLTLPHLFTPHSEIQFRFTKMVFPNGYTVDLSDAALIPANAPSGTAAASPGMAAAPPDFVPAVANVTVSVTTRNDVLLDQSAQMDMYLQLPISLEREAVASATRASGGYQLPLTTSSSQCRPTPGTPGTPDVVIPGTPATPDTVIPGGPGMPDVVIPGSPGTPATVIPGTPGSPGITCPVDPFVVPNAKQKEFKETLELTASLQVGGATLSPAKYQVSWAGFGPRATVEFRDAKKKVVATASAHVFILNRTPSSTTPETRNASDGSSHLQSLRFPDQALALYFDN